MHLRVSVALGVVALGAACGSGGSSASEEPPPQAASPANPKLLELDEVPGESGRAVGDPLPAEALPTIDPDDPAPVKCGKKEVLAYEACLRKHVRADDAACGKEGATVTVKGATVDCRRHRRFDNVALGTEGWEKTCQVRARTLGDDCMEAERGEAR